MKVRFSLRTLLLIVLLIASGATVWWNWFAWYPENVLVMKKGSGLVIPGFTTDGKALHIWCDGDEAVYDPRTFAAKASFKNQIFCGYATWEKLIALRDFDIHVYSSKTFTSNITLKTKMEMPNRLEFSPSNSYAVSSGFGAPILWNTGTGERVREFRTQARDESSHAIFLPDGHRVVATEGGNEARVWDVNRDAALFVLRGHAGAIHCISCSPDGSRIVTGSLDKSARVWDSSTGALLANLEHGEEILHLVWSPDGSKLATVADSTVIIWDAQQSYSKLSTVNVGRYSQIMALSFPLNRLISAYKQTPNISNFEIEIWDLSDGEKVDHLDGHMGFVTSANFDTADPNRFVSGSLDGTARIWRRRHAEMAQGIIFLPATWLVVLFGMALLYSIRHDRAQNRTLTRE